MPTVERAAVVAKIQEFLRGEDLRFTSNDSGCLFGITAGRNIRQLMVEMKFHISGALIVRFIKVATVGVDNDSIEQMQRVCEATAFINDCLACGRFSVDPRDGEVCFQLGTILADQLPTREQLQDCLHRSLQTVDEYLPFLEKAKDTSENKSIRKLIMEKEHMGGGGGRLDQLRQQLEQLGGGAGGDLSQLAGLLEQLKQAAERAQGKP